MRLDADHHIHTVYSRHSHAEMTVERIVAEAAALELRRIVILEHIPTIGAPGLALEAWKEGRNRRESLDRIAASLKEVAARYPAVQVLRGAEVDADPLSLDGAMMLEDLSGLDVVLGATHLLPGATAFWYERRVPPPEEAGVLAQTWRDWMLKFVGRGRLHVLAHPGDIVGVGQLLPPFDDPRTIEFFEPLLEAMREHNVAFELNESLGGKLPSPYREAYPALVLCAREAGLKFAVSSDAHQPDRIGRYAWVPHLIEQAGLSEKDLWTPPPPGR
jgi:histidinol phosphatase-like PHP family hydrolase